MSSFLYSHGFQKFLRLFRLIEFTLDGDSDSDGVPYVGT